MALIDSDGCKDGTKWDDIIIYLEWKFKLDPLIEKFGEADEVKETLNEAAEKMKYCFNEAMVKDWIQKLDDGMATYASFEQYVSGNF